MVVAILMGVGVEVLMVVVGGAEVVVVGGMEWRTWLW